MREVELELGSLGRFCAGDAPLRSLGAAAQLLEFGGKRVSIDLLMSGSD
jgi:L-ascorbate metabolism protein UlaG (beta-lactamase superfamily)